MGERLLFISLQDSFTTAYTVHGSQLRFLCRPCQLLVFPLTIAKGGHEGGGYSHKRRVTFHHLRSRLLTFSLGINSKSGPDSAPVFTLMGLELYVLMYTKVESGSLVGLVAFNPMRGVVEICSIPPG